MLGTERVQTDFCLRCAGGMDHDKYHGSVGRWDSSCSNTSLRAAQLLISRVLCRPLLPALLRTWP